MARYRNVTSNLVDSSRRLRADMTPAEVVLWRALRRRQLGDARFRRQCPLEGYVLDFCCPEHHLAIEVDGSVHDDQQDADAARTEYIETFGYRVIRFSNDAILHELDNVLSHIKTELDVPTSSPFPLPQRGEGGWGVRG